MKITRTLFEYEEVILNGDSLFHNPKFIKKKFQLDYYAELVYFVEREKPTSYYIHIRTSSHDINYMKIDCPKKTFRDIMLAYYRNKKGYSSYTIENWKDLDVFFKKLLVHKKMKSI